VLGAHGPRAASARVLGPDYLCLPTMVERAGQRRE